MDFNPTYFAHPKADDGMTLSHADIGIRKFWIDHGIACRKIGAAIGEALEYAVRHERLDSRRHEGSANRPRGAKAAIDGVARRDLCRARNRRYNLDAVESKLFGIGSESYVVGSHEYYLGYAITRKKLL